MAQQPSGWYTDPTSSYVYRYWNGTQWTNQVSSGGTTLIDPNVMDSNALATPPAPGSAAPTAPQPATQPTVQVTQRSGSGIGTIIGVALAVLAVIVLVLVLVNQSGDGSTDVPGTPTTNAPATTSAPATTVAP
jgi:hypothetical protein